MQREPSHPAVSLMTWYVQAGVDETIGEHAVDRYAQQESPGAAAKSSTDPAPPPSIPPRRDPAPPPSRPPARPATRPAAPSPATERAVGDAIHAVEDAASIDDIRAALEAFEGCALKRTATNLVIERGSAQARIVLVGEAPGAEEDRRGLPFVGPSGQLLDRMLQSVGLDERHVLITNTVFWRPPGNRPPSQAETAACQPFLRRLLELVDPEVVVALGGPASQTLLGRTDGVTKLRGRWFPLQSLGLSRPAQATVTFHPAYLLRSPAQKRLAWRDILAIRSKLTELDAEQADR